MSSPQAILDIIIGKIADAVIASVGRHVGFVVHYKVHLKKLEAEMKRLEDKSDEIKQEIGEAKYKGEEAEKEVLEWLVKVEEMKKEVEEFKNEAGAKENMRCFKFSCPDYIWRYRLSKQADEKILKGNDYFKIGEKFRTVSHIKPLPEELQLASSANYESFDSRAKVFNNIMEALTDSNVKMIGVYGPGGVGKTTMVEKVGKQAKIDGVFDEVVMAVVSVEAEVSKIQGQLADQLDVTLKGKSELGNAGQLWHRLNNGNKNLVILDDIWTEVLKLKDIGIPITEWNTGCKIVLTSRNRGVWKNMEVRPKEFGIDILEEAEAWALFKKKVENSVDSDHEVLAVAQEVCRQCGGLPVAINAVAAALKDRDLTAWKDARSKLKKSMIGEIDRIDRKLYTSFKLSYDFLSADAKLCFLLCCSYPEDENILIEDLVRYCMARSLLEQSPETLEEASDAVWTAVGTLKTTCLLLEGRDEDYVKMHDVIRDVAISIRREVDQSTLILVKHGVQEWPPECDKYSAIFLWSAKIQNKLPDELATSCPKLHTLMLQSVYRLIFRYLMSATSVSDRFFSGMENLTVLKLENMRLLPFPSSLANLVKLRMLCLHMCVLGDITMLKHLKKNLEILSLSGSDLKSLPPEIKELTQLRLLDLGNCRELEVIPQGVISNLTRLEELYMPIECVPTTTITGEEIMEITLKNANLVELKSLTRLKTLHIWIPKVELLPKDMIHLFDNLSKFRISVGTLLWIGSPSTRIFTRILTIGDICLLKDEFNVLLLQAEALYLYNVYGLKKILHDKVGEGFFNLKHLQIHGCVDLKHLLGKPESFRPSNYAGGGGGSSFNKLTELYVSRCRVKYLFSPSCARGLLQLQKLNIENC